MIGARLPNWLGDVLLARRALERLLEVAGPEELAGAAPAAFLPLLERVFPRVTWLTAGRGRSGAVALARAWRERRVRRVYLLPTSLSAQLAGLWSEARERVGFAPRPGAWREWEAGWLLTRRVPRRRRGERHLEDEYLDLVGGGGAAGEPRALTLPAAPLPEELQRLARDPFLLIAPGAQYGPAKRWPPERFAAAARLLLREGIAARAAVVGNREERDLCDGVASQVGEGALSLAGRTDLLGLAELASRARAVVANDSGVAHLASALGTPTIVLFGSTDPGWTAPRGPRVRVLYEKVRCSPCFRRTCPWRDDAYACLRVLEPRAVAAAGADLAAAGVA